MSDETRLQFTLRPEGFSHSQSFPLDTPVADVRDHLAEHLDVPRAALWMGINGEELRDGEVLSGHAVSAGAETDCEVRVEYLEGEKAKVHVENEDFLEVVIEDAQGGRDATGQGGYGSVRTLQVQIVRLPDWDKKPFLGGYRLKRRGPMYPGGGGQNHHQNIGEQDQDQDQDQDQGQDRENKDQDQENRGVESDAKGGPETDVLVEFHHASSQTPTQHQQRKAARQQQQQMQAGNNGDGNGNDGNNDAAGAVVRAHRDTQTVDTSQRSTQSNREAGTQMPRPGVYIDPRGAKVLHPGPYVTADDVLVERVAKAVRIQCFIRGWFARRSASTRREELARRHAEAEKEEEARREAADARRKAEVERRMRPRGAADFAVLHDELESWRLSETQRIKQSDLSAEDKASALALLLNKETRLLQTIDRLKIQASGENRDARISRLLSLMAAPKKWQLSDGTLAEVETPFTMRAKELMDLYAGLRLPLLGLDERLDVLLHVKWTVKEFDCNLTREIVELIDREADMLNRGRTERALKGLRKRLCNLFLQFVQTPEFNPEAVRFQKVPRELLRGDAASASGTNGATQFGGRNASAMSGFTGGSATPSGSSAASRI